MTRWYRLYKLGGDGKTPILLPEGEYPQDAREWKNPARTVGSTEITPDIRVSTVFLCLDHSHSHDPNDPPVLWETMVFGGESDGFQERYTSWDDAYAGHQDVVAKLTAGEVL